MADSTDDLDPEARVAGVRASDGDLDAEGRVAGVRASDGDLDLEVRVAGVRASDGDLDAEARAQRALDLAYRHLSRRDRSEAQLRRHLAGSGVGEPDADAAVAALIRQGYLDDARFARLYAEDRRALDGWGAERIERGLLAAGVDGELVAAAVGERDCGAELEAAVALLRRRVRAVPATDRERERALGMLVRRGYELELAHDAVRALASADDATDARLSWTRVRSP